MQRFPRFGRLLGLAVVAVWLGSPPWPVRAQPGKADPGARPGEKPPEDDKGPPRSRSSASRSSSRNPRRRTGPRASRAGIGSGSWTRLPKGPRSPSRSTSQSS